MTAIFTEKCLKCNGSGTFISYAGRVVGPCFTCKGRGVQEYKTSPEHRAKQRAKAAEKKDGVAQDWLDDHPEIADWLRENFNSFDFARSLLESVFKYGALTENQVAAAEKCIAKAKARKAEAEARRANDPGGFEKIVASFAAAKEAGLKRPKLRYAGMELKMAPDHGRNAGFVYVTDAGEYLGKIGPDGTFTRSRAATQDHIDALTKLAADPLAAAQMDGHATGQCCCCGRELTNPESVELGIGPICRGKWGWG